MIEINRYDDSFYSTKVNPRFAAQAKEIKADFLGLKKERDLIEEKMLGLSTDHEQLTRGYPLMERPNPAAIDQAQLDELRYQMIRAMLGRPDRAETLSTLKTVIAGRSPTEVWRDVQNVYVRLPNGGGKNGKVVLLPEGEAWFRQRSGHAVVASGAVQVPPRAEPVHQVQPLSVPQESGKASPVTGANAQADAQALPQGDAQRQLQPGA